MSPFILSSKDDRLRVRLWTGSDAVIDHTAQHSTGRLGVCVLLVGLARLRCLARCVACCSLRMQVPTALDPGGALRAARGQTHRHRQPQHSTTARKQCSALAMSTLTMTLLQVAISTVL
jgi:hypothetical protein